jgi:hypothetical protein
MKIQITIEEQILLPLYMSLLYLASSILRSNVQTFKLPKRSNVSTFNLQPKRSGATFNRWHLILEKVNSNNNSEQFPKLPLSPLFAPDSGFRRREKGRIECCLLRIVLEQFATPSHDGAQHGRLDHFNITDRKERKRIPK